MSRCLAEAARLSRLRLRRNVAAPAHSQAIFPEFAHGILDFGANTGEMGAEANRRVSICRQQGGIRLRIVSVRDGFAEIAGPHKPATHHVTFLKQIDVIPES